MKKTLVAVVVIVIAGAFLVASNSSNEESEQQSSSQHQNQSLADAHGFAIDKNDENIAYIANHSGLYMLDNGNLSRISEEQYDFMGFTPHPTENNTFYVSGHPKRGGNLGVLKTVDGGQTYEKISDGLNGPVDFHSMTISKADPVILYGAYAGQLQRSRDSGVTWEFASMPEGAKVISLATNWQDKETVYATTDKGIYVSDNQGDSWEVLYSQDTVISLYIDIKNKSMMIASFASQGLQQSKDGGKTWQDFGQSSFNAPVLFFDVQQNNPNVMYVLLQDLSIHKSIDKGETWKIVHQ